MSKSKISPCLWFDGQAEEAAHFYASIVPDSHVDQVHRAASDYPSGKQGDVLTVEFTVAGMPFVGLNGGPLFKFNEAVSFQVNCKTQDEIDYYWERLGEGGDPKAQQCGWLKDRYGLSWQVVPGGMDEMLKDADSAGAQRAMNAMMQMKKVDMDALQRAYDGP